MGGMLRARREYDAGKYAHVGARMREILNRFGNAILALSLVAIVTGATCAICSYFGGM